MLVDCSWGFGNNGCDGGEEWRAYEWIMKHGGIATTETYGAYMGMVRWFQDLVCLFVCWIKITCWKYYIRQSVHLPFINAELWSTFQSYVNIIWKMSYEMLEFGFGLPWRDIHSPVRLDFNFWDPLVFHVEPSSCQYLPLHHFCLWLKTLRHSHHPQLCVLY